MDQIRSQLGTRRRSAADNDGMQIRIEASDLPGRTCGPSPDHPGGYHNIHVAVQRRNRPDQLLDLVPGDARYATWTVDCTAILTPTGVDLRGPYIQGPPGGRFIHLSFGTVGDNKNFRVFRRAKLWLDGIPPGVLDNAQELGLLVGRLGLTDRKGNPLCAAVRPPTIECSRSCALTMGCVVGQLVWLFPPELPHDMAVPTEACEIRCDWKALLQTRRWALRARAITQASVIPFRCELTDRG